MLKINITYNGKYSIILDCIKHKNNYCTLLIIDYTVANL